MSIKINDYLNSYEFTCDLPSDGRTITFKPFTTGQMKKMLTYESSNDPFIIDTILDDIINDCVLDDDFNLDELLLQDRFYLLLKIRERSKGDTYSYSYDCTDCDTSNVGDFKISMMKIIPMDIDYTPIDINDKLSVSMRMITRGDQKEVCNLVKQTALTPDEKMVEVVTLCMAKAFDIFYVGDEQDADVPFSDKMDLINNRLPVTIFEKMKQWLLDNEFGIKLINNTKCLKCGKDQKYHVTVEGFFD